MYDIYRVYLLGTDYKERPWRYVTGTKEQVDEYVRQTNARTKGETCAERISVLDLTVPYHAGTR